MKSLATTAVVTLLLTLSLFAAGAGARTSGYTCSYRQPGNPIWARLTGTDLSAALCRAFAGGLGGYRVSYPQGTMRCQFMSLDADVYVGIYSTDGGYGRLFCTLLARQVRGSFLRIR